MYTRILKFSKHGIHKQLLLWNQKEYYTGLHILIAHINGVTAMRRLTTQTRTEKCVVRRYRRCANVIECTYSNPDSTAHYTLRYTVQPIAARLQICTACYCTEYCRQLKHNGIKILYYNGPGVDSASNRNKYQKYFLGVKAAGA
jgi:hypothetical protein